MFWKRSGNAANTTGKQPAQVQPTPAAAHGNEDDDDDHSSFRSSASSITLPADATASTSAPSTIHDSTQGDPQHGVKISQDKASSQNPQQATAGAHMGAMSAMSTAAAAGADAAQLRTSRTPQPGQQASLSHHRHSTHSSTDLPSVGRGHAADPRRSDTSLDAGTSSSHGSQSYIATDHDRGHSSPHHSNTSVRRLHSPTTQQRIIADLRPLAGSFQMRAASEYFTGHQSHVHDRKARMGSASSHGSRPQSPNSHNRPGSALRLKSIIGIGNAVKQLRKSWAMYGEPDEEALQKLTRPVSPVARAASVAAAARPGSAQSLLRQQFQALTIVLSDPSIVEMIEPVYDDPLFGQAVDDLQRVIDEAVEPSMDAPHAMQRIGDLCNPDDPLHDKLKGVARSIAEDMIQTDPAVPILLEQLQDKFFLHMVKSSFRKVGSDPQLRPLLKEIERLGPLALLKYWKTPEVLSKFGEIIGNELHLVPEFPEDYEQVLEEGDEQLTVEGEDEELQEEEQEEGRDQDDEDQEDEDEEELVDLHTAATEGDIDLLQELLAAGADANEVDEENRTALHFACGYGEVDCALLLLEAGAAVNALDANLNTPLHYAAGYGQAHMVDILVRASGNMELQNRDGYTCLQVAVMNDKQDVAEALQQAAK